MSDFCRLVFARRYHWWVVVFIVAGCKTAGNPGPIYKLQPPEERALAAPVAVSITDKRPAKERSYRRGAIEPADYQNGIETLTLENFEPQITDLLKQSFIQQLATLPTPPVWADVEVTRFRALIDRREILAAEYERQLHANQVGSAVDIGVGIGSGGGAIAGGLMAAAAASNSLRELEEQRSSWDHAMSGVTCEIEMHVELHWPNGQREAFDLQAKSHSMPPDDVRPVNMTDGMKWNIAPTVEKAISQIGEKLHSQAAILLRGAKSGNAAEAPRRPESSPRLNQPQRQDSSDEGLEPLPPPRDPADPSRSNSGAVRL